MLKVKSIIPLLVGLAVGFYAVKMGVDLVKRARGASAGGDVVRIVVARQPVPVGTQFAKEMVKLAQVPEALAPKGSIFEIKDVIGRVSSFSLRTGGYVSKEVLAPPGTPPGLSVRIPIGFRAVAVKVDEYSSVAGFLMPGSMVDIIVVMTTRRGNQRDTISRTLLEDIQVAAVGQEMADPKDPGAKITRSVTLLVKPKDAAVLHLAATKGDIRLALRHQDDSDGAERGYATESTLLSDEWVPANHGDDRKAAGDWWAGLAVGLVSRAASGQGEPAQMPVVAQAPGPEPWTVTLMRGNRVDEYVFASVDSSRRAEHAAVGNRGLLNSGIPKGRYSDVSGADEKVQAEDESDRPDWEGLPDD